VLWNSQSFRKYTEKFARGEIIEPDGHKAHFIEIEKGESVRSPHSAGVNR
jgi:hypothetical protein